MHDAAGRVAPEEGALRPAQHFHALNVEQLEMQAAHGGLVDVVQVYRDRVFLRIGKVIQANAAQEEVDHAGFCVGNRETQARCHRDHVGRVDEAQFTDCVGGKGGNRDTDLLQILLAPLRGNDDFLEFLRVGRGRPVKDRNGQYNRQDTCQMRPSIARGCFIHLGIPPYLEQSCISQVLLEQS